VPLDPLDPSEGIEGYLKICTPRVIAALFKNSPGVYFTKTILPVSYDDAGLLLYFRKLLPNIFMKKKNNLKIFCDIRKFHNNSVCQVYLIFLQSEN
jgi:hypothetical protein